MEKNKENEFSKFFPNKDFYSYSGKIPSDIQLFHPFDLPLELPLESPQEYFGDSIVMSELNNSEKNNNIFSPEIHLHLDSLNLKPDKILTSFNTNGYKIFYKNSIIFTISITDSTTEFFNLDGFWHRINGPAFYCNGNEKNGKYFFHGKEISQEIEKALCL